MTTAAPGDPGISNSTDCKLLPSSNSSFPLAKNWENIPETLILNASVGFILFLIFMILTQIAWSRSHNDSDYTNQNLVSFLYGYRDPELWYVMPRLEFLKRNAKHHLHDMGYPYIYVPPKLPLATPIESLDFKSLDSRSIDETAKDSNQTIKSMFLKTPGTIKNNEDQESNISPISSKKNVIAKADVVGRISLMKAASPGKNSKGKQLSPLETSFFYPSIFSAEQLQASSLSRILNKFFSIFFRVTDADIIYAKGIDAYEYLLFQRHLIMIMFIINIFCIGIILPVHWFLGENHRETDKYVTTSFQRSTIKNLMYYQSNYYWAHILCSIFIVAITMRILSSYRDSTANKHNTHLARRTLLIGNIPVEQRNRVELQNVIGEYFTGSNIEAIQFVYNTASLERYHMQLDAIIVAKEYCYHYKRKYNREIMVRPTDVNENGVCNGLCRLCSFFHICCCYWPCESRQPGTVFYTQREQHYRNKIKRNCEQMVHEPSEYAFVTFKSNRQARRVMERLAHLKTEILAPDRSTSFSRARNGKARSSSPNSIERVPIVDIAKKAASNQRVSVTSSAGSNDPLDPKNNPHIRSIRSPLPVQKVTVKGSKQVEGQEPSLRNEKRILEGPLAWSVRYAPHPDNVEYYDLLNIATTSKFTTVLLHLLMVVIFIFFTTPNVILSIVERWSVLQPDKAQEKTGFQSIMINYVSILIQIATTAALPSLVTLISKQIPYEDTASKSYAMMWKVYLFLVLMVIVLPSVGMSSAQAFLTSSIKTKCLFPTDNGAYFINYVVTAVFLSTVLELLKPIDILSYYFILWTGRSKADYEGGRQYIEREFSVSMQHTGVLLVFSVVLTYTISCPLIAPAGLLYLLVKHAVDHYHLFYTYSTKKVDKNLRTTIEIFVKVALLLMLFQTAAAITISLGTGYLPLMSQTVFGMTLAIFLCNCFYDFTSSAVMPDKRNRHHQEFCACFYLPRVIEDLLRSNAIPDDCISRQV